ncbi:hypothetical protein [Flavobacterium beibuense]|uniref:Uncharacterized protein n=1 Tax=Flavobacterium beibuense F44-8 TaxID=1406840 RepID=A0A0A2LPF7_9FLAO|nr:hypothetical protein [Flavobacterium beibuense]KGO81206.1 hypothetical protein Q763_08985 [Flavobacterium beibuense F44-8]
MKKIILLLALIFLKFSAYAQEKEVSDLEKKNKVSIAEDVPEQLESEGFSFESVLFESESDKNYINPYSQESKKHTSNNFFSMYVEKYPEGHFSINTYSNSPSDDASNGFSLGKWNNKKGVELNISLGGKCGF